jgi:hypothetical protein
MNEINTPPTSHGGLLIPLDMFRISHLAGIITELLVSKARNIVGSKLVLVRHPGSQLILGRIEGKVVGDDGAAFWRENADIGAACSQALPRQCFLYYAKTAPAAERREGFVVSQRGQIVAADDSTAEQQPAGGGAHWPVTKLCEQLHITLDELAAGFEGGPRVEVDLVEPDVDDQAALLTLAGRDAEGGDPDGAAGDGPPAAAPAAAAKPAKPSVIEDMKRRETERAADEAARQQRSEELKADLAYEIDDLGIVLTPEAELSESDVLSPLVRAEIGGDLPPGVPKEHGKSLQGKRCDIAIRVDFLSEVFVESAPLSKPLFNERAETRTVSGATWKVLEVLAPRIGYGTLVSTGTAPHVFISRKPELTLPEALVGRLLG